MLPVQVNYWALQETIRHNRVTEDQNVRSLSIQQQDANTRRFVAEEGARHNLVIEEQAWQSLAETRRHNLVMEDIGYGANAIQMFNAETNRINADTGIKKLEVDWFNASTNRLAVEQNYMLGLGNLAVAQTNAATNIRNADIRQEEVRNAYELGTKRNELQADQNFINLSRQNTEQLNVESQVATREQELGIHKANVFIEAWNTGVRNAFEGLKILQFNLGGD